MNILAHAYLSERHAPWLIGNFIGDFIKGDPAHPRHGLTTGEVAGVRLHRAIDAFTDAHPDVAAVRTLLYPRCHKYAGVAVDVFFDYQLAVTFAPLTGESLPTFVADFYAVLQTHVQRLPAPARHMMYCPTYDVRVGAGNGGRRSDSVRQPDSGTFQPVLA